MKKIKMSVNTSERTKNIMKNIRNHDANQQDQYHWNEEYKGLTDYGWELLNRKEALGFATPEVTLDDFSNLLPREEEGEEWVAQFRFLQADIRTFLTQRNNF